MDIQERKRAWLSEALQASGLSARDLAQGVGIPESSLSQMRSGRRAITDATLQRLAAYLQATLPDMYVERSEPTHPHEAPQPHKGRRLEAEVEELRRLVLQLVTQVNDLRVRQEALEHRPAHGRRAG